MAFCSGCGNEVGSDVGFCPKCGRPVSSAAAQMGASPAAGSPPAPAAAGAGMEENVAGLLSYVLGWLTGLIFFLIDKRPFVRFHAMQSIIVFGGAHILFFIFFFGGFLGGVFGGLAMAGISWAIYLLSELALLVCWILCMVKAFQGQRFKLPVVGNIAEGFAK